MIEKIFKAKSGFTENKQTNNQTSIKTDKPRGAWVARSVKGLTSAQVMFSQFMGSRSASASVLTAQSLEPASDSVSPSLSVLSPRALCVSLSLKNK